MNRHQNRQFIILLLIVTFCCIFNLSAHAATNRQKTYTLKSEEWKTVAALCTMAGVTAPNASGPVTQQELIVALNRIDKNRLSEKQRRLFESTKQSFDSPDTLYHSDNFSVQFKPQFSFEAYMQTKDTPTMTFEDWLIPYRERKPFIDLKLEMTAGKNFYGFLDLMFKMRNNPEFATGHFSHNWQGGFVNIQAMHPFKAGIVACGNVWNLSIARDRLEVGRGYTGNMTVGDNFSYQEYLKFGITTNPFSYSFIMTHFDQQTGPISFDSFSFNGPHQQRITHRFSINICDRVMVGISDNSMFQTQSGFDIRMLNPFMFLHNYNIFGGGIVVTDNDQSNNFMGFELEVPIYPGWLFTAQGILDQIQTSGEQGDGSDPNMYPNAWGALGNISGTWAVGDGILQGYAEGAYTSPYLYQNKKRIGSMEGSPDWNRDLIVGYGIQFSPEISYTGYVHGPDSIVAAMGVTYWVPNFWSIAGQLLYKAHGQQGIAWHDGQNPETETGSENLNRISPTGIVEHTLQGMVSATVKVTPGVSFNTTIGAIQRWNNKNIENATWFDLQFAIGCTIDPIAILMKTILK